MDMYSKAKNSPHTKQKNLTLIMFLLNWKQNLKGGGAVHFYCTWPANLLLLKIYILPL